MKKILFTIMALAIAVTVHAKDKWRSEQTVTQTATSGSATLSETLNPGKAFKLKEIRLNLSTAASTAEDFTVVVASTHGGSAYNATLLTKAMAAVKTYLFIPTGDESRFFTTGDRIDAYYRNTDGRTWGLEWIYEINE
jgi:hypothetical protein